MGLLDLKIKNSYTGKGKKILSDFLLPVLSESKYYNRITGYFTVESLLAISQGIEKIFAKNGKMRLIIGVHSIPEEIIEAECKREYMQNQISVIRSEIAEQIVTLTNSLEKRRLATLAWMIEDGLLEVKAASVLGEGLFHPKTLIFTDVDGFKLAAVGSSNETANGLGGNFEQLMVVNSWENSEAVQDQENFFDSLWWNRNREVFVSDITCDMEDLLVDTLGDELKQRYDSKIKESDSIIEDASKMPANFFVSGDIPSLFMHQERAVIDALSRWPVRVLFSDEVGLGKTFEAASTLVFLVKYCGIKRVMILTPKSVLKQWQEELYIHFGLNTWVYDSSSTEYISSIGARYPMNGKNPVGPSSPDIILMSAQYARGSGSNLSVLEKADTVLPDLLILDEAHSARISDSLTGGKKKTRMYKILEELSSKIPHIILATATPMQKDAEEYHALLKLLGLPKIWNKPRNYKMSLKLIKQKSSPDISDASSAATLLYTTMTKMKPTLSELNEQEQNFIYDFLESYDSADKYSNGAYVIDNWPIFREMFVRFHPARLLTVRNTRRALEEVGYIFPKRNLVEINIDDSEKIELFYSSVNEYLSDTCFSIEKVLYPDKKINVGFVRISYQQRVASSLYSCKESLRRRYEVALKMKKYLTQNDYLAKIDLSEFGYMFDFDDDIEEDFDDYEVKELSVDFENDFDYLALNRAVSLECTSLSSLIKQAEKLLYENGDLKIKNSIDQAMECIKSGDLVLVFSRYTDTIDGLLDEFNHKNINHAVSYGIYTGKKSVIVKNGKEEECDKNTIKQELYAQNIKIVFCSDAASEGLNLQAARVLINVDVPWTPARLEQRIGRIARLGQVAKEVDVYNVWYPHSIEARMYHRIQMRLEETNLAIGEFPEVVANGIKKSLLEGTDDTSMKELMDIRNSYQVQALEELWYKKDEKYTTSDLIRKQLVNLCDRYFDKVKETEEKVFVKYILPDNHVVCLTESPGMAETISLQSEVWKYCKIKIPKVGVYKKSNGLPIGFVYENNDCMLKHEMVFELGEREFVSEMILDSPPKMLPNPEKLSLKYAVNESLGDIPDLWK